MGGTAIDIGNAIGEARGDRRGRIARWCVPSLAWQPAARAAGTREVTAPQPPPRRSRTLHYGFDHRNRTGLALARTLWLQGFPDQARRWADQVEAEAVALDHPVTHCIALVWTLCIYTLAGDLDKAEKSLRDLREHRRNAYLFGPYIAAVLGHARRHSDTGRAVPATL